eukprot:6467005-Amphidinium_carterae.1
MGCVRQREVHQHMAVSHPRRRTQLVLDAHNLRAGHILDPTDGRLSSPVCLVISYRSLVGSVQGPWPACALHPGPSSATGQAHHRSERSSGDDRTSAAKPPVSP